MEVKAPKPGLLHMDDVSDPEDKEISEDDDDRNHKHRRREEYSQSLEGDSSGQFFNRPYRRQNKSFGNGHPSREGSLSTSDTWKNYNDANQETDLSVRFDKRRPNIPSFPRGGTDMNQRARTNLSMSTDPSPAKGRGRDGVMYGQRDSRFRQVDLAAQLVQHGSIPPNLFSGRGLPTVPHVPGRSWNAFGFIPTIPSGGLDSLHSIGLQVPLRPPINPSWGIGIPRQRCRDFEERGFCLRGDMCPMEHGVNRIVVDDMQSLSQFNLPAVNVLGTSAGQGPLPANASTSTFMSNKGLQIKNGKRGLSDDGMGLNNTFGGTSVGVSDSYDPDQPLWTNNGPEIAPARMAVSGSNFHEVEPLTTGKDSSGHYPTALSDGNPSDIPKTSAEITGASQSSSVWGRIGGSKSKLEVKPNTVSTLTPSSDNLENEMKKDTDLVEISQGVVVHQEQETNTVNTGLHVPVSSSKLLSDPGYNFRRQYPKADRTLFVSGIPLKENRREALLSHFKRFGVVVDIYIPSNSDRAFVQFSKREEAETALKSPDAIMGNRFIKITWANRDNRPDLRNGGTSNPSDNTKGVTVASGPPSLPATIKGHDNVQVPAIKGMASIAHVALSKSDVTKPTISSPKAPLPSQKKLETLEILKEELRKKQEMLAQKRNEFKRQLDKLEKQKQATLKDEGGSDPPSKRHKSEAVVESSPKTEIPEPASDSGSLSLPLSEKKNDSGRSGEGAVSPSSKSVLLEPRSLKPSIRAMASSGPPFINKYTLDNRPTVFIVHPPLPAGLATAFALKEHFSSYGELAYVDLTTSKDKENNNNNDESDAMTTVSARIAYKTRQSAERAFSNGKNWQGHELQLKWEIITTGGGKVSKESSQSQPNKNPSLDDAGETATITDTENIKSENLVIQEEEEEEEKTAQSENLNSDEEEEDDHLNN